MAFCLQPPYSPPPPSQWQQISAIVIPVVSVVGGVVTYVAVGDRVIAAIAPVAHGNAWHGVALFITIFLAPLLAMCFFCCRASVKSAVEGFAAGILTRLADMEESRRKSAAARRKLASSIGRDDGQEQDSASTGVKAPVHAAVTGETHANPLRAVVPKDAAPIQESPWQRHEDGKCVSAYLRPKSDFLLTAPIHTFHPICRDVWYVNKVTGESSWTLP